MSVVNNGAAAKKGRRILRRIGSAIKRNLNVKTIWRKPGPKKVLIVYLALLAIFTGLAVWKAASQPAAINFPKLTYQEITDRIVRDRIQYWGFKDISEGMAADSLNISSEIFVRTKEGETFRTEAINFQILRPTQLLKHVSNGEIKDIIYNPLIMPNFAPSQIQTYSSSLAVGQFRNGDFFIVYFTAADFFSDDVQKTLRAQWIEAWPIHYFAFDDSNFGARWGWTIVAVIFWGIFPLLIFSINAELQYRVQKTEIEEEFEKPAVRLSDVAGIDEAKTEILKVIDFIMHPEAYMDVGAQLPAGILLEGAPGVGKTLLAKAIAGECGLPFVVAEKAGFMEIYVGTGAREVRRLFDRARHLASSLNKRVIVFIDEIDAVGSRSGEGGHGGEDEKNRTIAQLNQEIDGLQSDRRLIVLATTNKPENIDPALLRPGRLTLRIVVPTPSFKGRVDILAVHTKGKPLAPDVDLEKIAHFTPTGMTGADLMNIANTAALEAGSQRKKAIEMKDFEKAVIKIMTGEELKSLILSPEDKWTFSVHEAGHTIEGIVLNKLGFNIPLPTKISIIPTTKGMGGYTQLIEKEERLLLTRKQGHGMIMALYGGRLAEEMIIGEISSGAKNDYDRASAIEEQMATNLGMESEELGQRIFTINTGSGYLGQANRLKPLSQEKSAQIDRVIDKRLTELFEKARGILADHRQELEQLARRIRDNETIEVTRDMIESIKVKEQ